MGKYKIYHTFKKKMVVPLVAITPNIEWICDKEKEGRIVTTSDNITARVASYKHTNALSNEAKDLIKEMYKMDVSSYLQRWYDALNIVSLEVVYLELEEK